MPEIALEERIAKLEGLVDGFDSRFDSLERRFDAVDRRFERVEQRIDALDAKLDHRVDSLQTTMTSQYRWLLGTQLTVFVTVIAVLAGALFR